ncbi:MAG: DNA-3-methyladenine glycosylase [Solirubrobacterales bacterium]
MKLGRRLPRSFFARPSTKVAPDLLGRVLVRILPDGGRLSATIVETEAYGEGDPASHAFRGRTPRNAVMFGPPGHLYVYFTYGMHFCMNVVTESEGRGSAVLLRAAEPLQGHEAMAERRGTSEVRRLCSGPARWTQAFGIARQENGADLVRGREVYLLEGEPVPRSAIRITTRVGVNVGIERPWRFLVAQSPFVSPGRPSRITG